MNSGLFLFLDSISGGEMILVFLVFLMLFGSKNIPDVARSLGKAMRQFKEATSEIQRDIEKSSRELKSQIDAETRSIRSGLDVDISPTPQIPGQSPERLSEEDRLAGSSTPPPAVAPAPPAQTPAPTAAPPVTPIDIPVTPTEDKPSA